MADKYAGLSLDVRALLNGRTLTLTGCGVLKKAEGDQFVDAGEVKDLPRIDLEIVPDYSRLKMDIAFALRDGLDLGSDLTPTVVEGEEVLRSIYHAAYNPSQEVRSWMIRTSRKLLTWHNLLIASGNVLARDGSIRTFPRIIGHLLPRVITGVYWDLPTELQGWYIKDVDKLSPLDLADLALRMLTYAPNGLLTRYALKNVMHIAGGIEGIPRGYVEGLVRQAFKDLIRGEKRPWVVGFLPKYPVPDTPWHTLLAGMFNKRASKSGPLIPRFNIEYQYYTKVLDLVPQSKEQKWLAESSESQAISILGWEFFTNKVMELEKDLLTPGKVGWGHPLSGMRRGKCELPDKNPPVEAEEEGGRYLGAIAQFNFLGANIGESWVYIDHVLDKSIGYIRDGLDLYEKHKGVIIEVSGKTLRMQPIKGSFSRMLKDARYNHNIERHFVDPERDKDFGEPLWVPPEMTDGGGPLKEIEHLRVKTKGELKLIGKEAGHCVGGRVGLKKLFYHDGAATAEVAFETLEVIECRGAHNSITDRTKKLEATLVSTMRASTAHTRAAIHKALVDDWKREHRWRDATNSINQRSMAAIVVDFHYQGKEFSIGCTTSEDIIAQWLSPNYPGEL